MLCLISFYQTIGTCKVVSSQTCSDNEGLVPDDITIYRRVLAHASLYHVATADFISSSSISIISTACRKSHTGCNFFQFPHSFSQLSLMRTPNSWQQCYINTCSSTYINSLKISILSLIPQIHALFYTQFTSFYDMTLVHHITWSAKLMNNSRLTTYGNTSLLNRPRWVET